ncbi:MAG: hypothetical protein ABID87_01625 [Chloroflexota bacterium]
MWSFKVSAIPLTVVLVFLLGGCAVSPAQYEELRAQISEVQSQNAELRADTSQQMIEQQQQEAELRKLREQNSQLETQMIALEKQYQLAGKTPAETAANIARQYHETHVYSTYDLFVCSDMAAEVWNMLKAQGISAVIAVGDVDAAVSDIVLCNHAWVLADVAPGERLALETTGGVVVPESQNPLYYRGWYFDSPRELKSHNELIREYNVRVGIRNQIADEVNKVIAEHNRTTSQSTADKLKAVYDKLVEIKEAHEAELNRISAEVNGLATKLG